MDDNIKYEKVLSDYRDLQLRFTRFSAVEQELINARDRLDQELELYKRLQQYSYEVLSIDNIDELLHITAEALVDILETECAVVYYRNKNNDSESRLIIEGAEIISKGDFIKNDVVTFFFNKKFDKPVFLQKNEVSAFDGLGIFKEVILKSFTENNFGYDLYFLAGNSSKNEKLYRALEDKHKNIFSIFVHQMHSVIANKKKSQTIEEQIKQISKSQFELKKLSLIATKSKSGVIITDAFGKIEWINEAFTKISGYTLDEVMGLKPKDFLQGPENTAEEKQKLSVALSEKKDIEIVLVNRTKDGTPYYNQLEIIPVFDDYGNHTNFIGIQKDITTEKKYNEEIIKINSRFEQIASFSNIGIWERDLKNNSNTWNNELLNILGIDSIGLDKELFDIWQNSIHEDNKENVIINLKKLYSGELKYTRHEYKIIRLNDKSVRNIQSLIIGEHDETGNIIRLIGSIQDITEIKTLQNHLEKAIVDRDNSLVQINEIKAFYERILKNSPTQILVFDKDLKLSFSNTDENMYQSIWNIPEATQLTPYSSDTDHNNIYKFISEAVSQKKLVQIEDTFIQNGKEVYYLRTILPYFNHEGKIENIFVIGVDITDLKKVENDIMQKKEELEKINMELDHFVYSISHDLRSPLLSIKGIIGLVLKSSDISENNRKFLEMTISSATRLDDTIQEILDYSRNSRLEISYSNFDIKELISIVFEDLRFSANTDTELSFKTNGSSFIFSDKARFGVLMKNIIGNCIKYRKQNVPSKIEVDITEFKNEIKIVVKDNGEGIPSEHLSKVFDMFYRATSTSVGTGLGLYICKEIINKLEGSISLDSELEKGTTVTLMINKHNS